MPLMIETQQFKELIGSYTEQSATQLLSVLSKKSPKDLRTYILHARNILRIQAEESFYSFYRQAWKHIWPAANFADSWYYHYLCREMQTVAERNLNSQRRGYHLNVNVPPRTAKSTIISICLPVWIWIKDPRKRFITTSYSPALALDMSSKSVALMKSDWFRYNWGDKFKLTKDTPSDYSNDKGGRRIITSPGCLIGTGFGGDFVISDDPENAEQIYSDVARVKAHRWWDETISSRLDEPNIGILINLQQRLHQDDLTGYLRKNQASLYKFIVLPAEESDDVEPMELRARYVDGLLFPQRLSAEVLADKKIQQRNTYPGQYQQSPVAVGGNLFKEAWVRFFTRDQVPPFDRILVSADTANTDLTSSCPVSIQVWAEKIPDYYLLYDETVQMSPKTTETRIGAIANMYPGSQIVVEWAASGFGCIEGLKKTHSGVFAFDPRKYGGKEKRADSIRYLWESGNVFIPDNEYMRTQYLPEIYVFPNGKYMDRVDSMAQALIFFTRRNGSDGVRGVYDRGNIY